MSNKRGILTSLYLMIEFPYIHHDDVEYTVVYFEKVYDCIAVVSVFTLNILITLLKFLYLI